MMTLPLVLRGDVRPFVIVGGGPVAARKADTLVKAGAEVLLIAPQVTADIQYLPVLESGPVKEMISIMK